MALSQKKGKEVYMFNNVSDIDANWIRNRITNLRLAKNVSEYQMSLDLGMSRGYINNISSGKTLPSMSEFLNICDYFDISPSTFFDEKIEAPLNQKRMNELFIELENADQEILISLSERLDNYKKRLTQ